MFLFLSGMVTGAVGLFVGRAYIEDQYEQIMAEKKHRFMYPEQYRNEAD